MNIKFVECMVLIVVVKPKGTSAGNMDHCVYKLPTILEFWKNAVSVASRLWQ